MTSETSVLVYTDLDGTLIDHQTYDWSPARPALQAIQQASGGIILASSKTAAEMTVLRKELALTDWPAIVENGAGVLDPGTLTQTNAAGYAQIRAILDANALRSLFTGFGDMSVAEVAEATGLSEADAMLAKTRTASEPGIWTGTPSQRTVFEADLLHHGVTAREGGRFLTLSFGCKKSDHMTSINAQYQPAVTIALGDAPNDIEMLEAADFAVIVANPHRAPLPMLDGEAHGRIIRTKAPGPTGWNTAVLDLLARLELNRN